MAAFFILVMATDKKSFILYADLIYTVRKLPPDIAGKLFLTILQYVNDENPQVDDLIVDIAFEPVKQQLKRDLQKWDEHREKQSLNGKRGGRPRIPAESEINPNNQPLFFESEKSLNDNVNVSVSVSENAIVNANDNVINKDIKGSMSASPPARLKKEAFKVPTLEEVKAFAEAEMIGDKDLPDRFHNYYESNGWKVGKNSMKSWTAAYKNWSKNENHGTYQQSNFKQGTGKTQSETDFERWKNLGTDLDKGRRQLSEMLNFPTDQ